MVTMRSGSAHSVIITKNRWMFQTQRGLFEARFPRSQLSFRRGTRRRALRMSAIVGDADGRGLRDHRGGRRIDRPHARNRRGLCGGAGEWPVSVRVISPGSLPPGWTGKNNAVVAGAGVARGEWLLFTDADTVHLPGSLRGRWRRRSKRSRSAVVLAGTDRGDILGNGGASSRVCRAGARIPTEGSFRSGIAHCCRERPIHSDSPGSVRRGRRPSGHRGQLLEDVALARAVKESGRRIYFRYAADIVRTLYVP